MNHISDVFEYSSQTCKHVVKQHDESFIPKHMFSSSLSVVVFFVLFCHFQSSIYCRFLVISISF